VLTVSSTVEKNRKDTQQKAGSEPGRGHKQNKNKKKEKQRKEEKNNDANKKQQQKRREKPAKSAETQTRQRTDGTEENTTIQRNKKRDLRVEGLCNTDVASRLPTNEKESW
jgi:hypothetical protein